MIMKKIFIGIILATLCTVDLMSQNVKVTAELDKTTAEIGDHLTLTVKATSEPKTGMILPELRDSIGNFEILETSDTDTLLNKEKLVLQRKYVLICFDTGKFVIPELTVMYNRADMNSYYPAHTKPINVIIRGVPVGKSLIDIKPPLGEPAKWYEYLPYSLLLIPLALIIAFIYLYKKYKKNKKPVIKPEPKREEPKIPAHILAIAALDKLRTEKLWMSGHIKLHYIKLSEIIRTYISRRFQISAMEMASFEILDSLKNSGLNNENMEKLNRLFELSDLSKFAKFQPDDNDNEKALDTAFDFINNTKDEVESVRAKEKEA